MQTLDELMAKVSADVEKAAADEKARKEKAKADAAAAAVAGLRREVDAALGADAVLMLERAGSFDYLPYENAAGGAWAAATYALAADPGVKVQIRYEYGSFKLHGSCYLEAGPKELVRNLALCLACTREEVVQRRQRDADAAAAERERQEAEAREREEGFRLGAEKRAAFDQQIANLKAGLWRWPEGLALRLYKVKWCTGIGDGGGEDGPVAEYAEAWSIEPKPHDGWWPMFRTDRYPAAGDMRLRRVGFSPNTLYTVDQVSFERVDDLPYELKEPVHLFVPDLIEVDGKPFFVEGGRGGLHEDLGQVPIEPLRRHIDQCVRHPVEARLNGHAVVPAAAVQRDEEQRGYRPGPRQAVPVLPTTEASACEGNDAPPTWEQLDGLGIVHDTRATGIIVQRVADKKFLDYEGKWQDGCRACVVFAAMSPETGDYVARRRAWRAVVAEDAAAAERLKAPAPKAE